jgi:hypothetical protein
MTRIVHGQVPKIMNSHSNSRLDNQKRLMVLVLVLGRAMVLINQSNAQPSLLLVPTSDQGAPES